jgi:thioredoxin-related protein
MRANFLGLMLLLMFAGSSLAAETPPGADQVLAQARMQASEQHKNIFLIFSASWCGYCRKLDALLASPEVNPIIARHYVIARLSVSEEYRRVNPKPNSPGAEELVSKLGGPKGPVPFFAFLDSNGKLIINSCRPVKDKPAGENIGFPVEPNEIAWFMTMLRKGAPDLTRDEALVIESSLRNQ